MARRLRDLWANTMPMPGNWIALVVLALFAAYPTVGRSDDDPAIYPVIFCLREDCPDNGKASDKDKSDACKKNGDDKKDDKEDEPKIHYGPGCEPRKTLMQWSYGTTFSGGPPSMDEPLESDRPDFSESSKTVGKGVVQLETGYDFILDHHAGDLQTDHSFPDTLWRIGMFAEWFEWRIEYNYEIINDTISNGASPPIRHHLSGSDDLRLGFKVCLTPQEGILPSMGINPQMTVPSGSPGLTEGEVMPGVVLAYEWELNKVISVSMISELDRARDDVGNDFTQFEQAISVQYQLTKKLHVYTEWVMFSPTGQTIERVQHLADGGFVFHVTNNLQLDIEAGVGLNEAAEDFFAGTGAVIRY